MPKRPLQASAAPFLMIVIALVFVTHAVLSGILWIFPEETARLTGQAMEMPQWDTTTTLGPMETEMFPAAPMNSVTMPVPTVMEPVPSQPLTSAGLYPPALPPPLPTPTPTATTGTTCGNGFLITGNLSHIPTTFDLSPCFDSCTQDPETMGLTMSCTGLHCPEGCRLPQGSQPAACTTCANLVLPPAIQPTTTVTSIQTMVPPPLPPVPVCKISGNPCGNAGECCSGLACMNGTCSAYGVPPTLQLCLAGGQTCMNTSECCGGLACTNGKCVLPPPSLPPPSTGSCSQDTDCPPGSVCEANAQGIRTCTLTVPPPPPPPGTGCTAGYYCKGQFMNANLPVPCTAQEGGASPAVCCDAKDLQYKEADCQPTTCSDGMDNNPNDHQDIKSIPDAFQGPYTDATEPNCYNCSVCAEAAMKEGKKTPPLLPYTHDSDDSLVFDPKKDESTPCEAGQNPIASTFLGSLLEKTGLLASRIPCARRCRTHDQCMQGQECGRTPTQIANNEEGNCQNRQWRELEPPHRIPWCSKNPLYTLPAGDVNRPSAARYVGPAHDDRAVCEADANIGRDGKCCTTGDLANASSCSDAHINTTRVNGQWVYPCTGDGKNGFFYELPNAYNANEAITCTDNNRQINQEERNNRYLALQYSNGDPLPAPWPDFYSATCSRVWFAVYQTVSGRTSAICTNTPIFSCQRTGIINLFPGEPRPIISATGGQSAPPHYFAPPFLPASAHRQGGERVFNYAFNSQQTCQQALRQPYYLNEGDDCTYSFPCRRGFTCKEQNPNAANVANRNARCVMTSSIRAATPNGFLRGGITCSGQNNDAQCAPGLVCGTSGGNAGNAGGNNGGNAGGNQNNNQQRTCCIADSENAARCALNKTGNEQRVALYTFAGQLNRFDGPFIALYNLQCAIGRMQGNNNNGGQGNGLSPSVCAFYNVLEYNIRKLNGLWRG